MSSDTSDPNTAHMRVFVGNLNTPNITKPTLQNIFGKYGAILGNVLLIWKWLVYCWWHFTLIGYITSRLLIIEQ